MSYESEVGIDVPKVTSTPLLDAAILAFFIGWGVLCNQFEGEKSKEEKPKYSIVEEVRKAEVKSCQPCSKDEKDCICKKVEGKGDIYACERCERIPVDLVRIDNLTDNSGYLCAPLSLADKKGRSLWVGDLVRNINYNACQKTAFYEKVQKSNLVKSDDKEVAVKCGCLADYTIGGEKK